MNTKTLQEIDYFRIREEIAGYCVSAEGRQKLLEREPLRKPKKLKISKISAANGAHILQPAGQILFLPGSLCIRF